MKGAIMTQFEITVAGNTARCESRRGILTPGMTGASVKLAFDSAWDGLRRTAVFRCGGNTCDVLLEEDNFPIPPSILAPEQTLELGLYGTDGESTVIPTVWVTLGTVHPGADPSGDESTDPALPVWAQLQAKLDALEMPDVAAAVESYLRENPLVGQPGPQGEQGPQGEKGDPGEKGEAGYTPIRGADYWTEADKAEIKSYVEEAILGGAW